MWSSSGLSFLTAPEWSPEQVSHWLQHVGLGKHSEGATEKGFNGRQLMDLDTGKIKVRCTLPSSGSGGEGKGEGGGEWWRGRRSEGRKMEGWKVEEREGGTARAGRSETWGEQCRTVAEFSRLTHIPFYPLSLSGIILDSVSCYYPCDQY